MDTNRILSRLFLVFSQNELFKAINQYPYEEFSLDYSTCVLFIGIISSSSFFVFLYWYYYIRFVQQVFLAT